MRGLSRFWAIKLTLHDEARDRTEGMRSLLCQARSGAASANRSSGVGVATKEDVGLRRQIEKWMNKMKKAVIFDIDGTLVDSVDLHARAWQKAFEHFHIEANYIRLREQIGKGADKLMPVFLSEDDVARRAADIQDYRENLFHREFQHLIRPFSCVRSLFEQILGDGIKIALASSSKGQDLAFYKALLHVEDLLHAETSSDDAEESKPEPDIFEAALDGLHLTNPAEALVVGDTPHDAEAAKKAGMQTVGFRCGGVPDDRLQDAGCISLYFGPADLLARYHQSLIVLDD